jgi:predicted enzyme related to lactoylglutathione lyase
MAMKFVGVCLVTRNVPLLAQFYVHVLGAQAEGDETHVELRTAGAQLTIFSFEGMEQMAPGSMHGAGADNVTLGFEVQDVDAEYDRLRALAVEVVKPPASYPWGSRSVWFRDPDGNIVDFFARLAT